ncbi:MAG TPA: hypothetical protein VK917_04405 [Ilumatobacter sp.]|nr:hypothetical protein [Ilumatobacter sp.]
MTTSGTCESCGVDDEQLTPVRRKYLAAPDGSRAERILDEVERWCIACLTSYPHEPAD